MHSQTVLPLHCHNLLHGGLICCRVTHVMEKTFFNMSDYHNIEIVWRDVMLSCCGTCGTRPTNEFHSFLHAGLFFCIVTHVMKTHILTYMIITILSMYGVMSLSNLTKTKHVYM